jgi:hypothetical protein
VMLSEANGEMRHAVAIATIERGEGVFVAVVNCGDELLIGSRIVGRQRAPGINLVITKLPPPFRQPCRRRRRFSTCGFGPPLERVCFP